MEEETTQQLTGFSMFGDLSNKATIMKWGRSLMVDVAKENDITAHVQYGIDDFGKPIRMKVHKEKDKFRRLSPEEASAIVQEAMAFANENNAKGDET